MKTCYVVLRRKPNAVQGGRIQYQTKGKISFTQGIAFLKEKRVRNNMPTLFRALRTQPQATD
jgi:hypothetical protein